MTTHERIRSLFLSPEQHYDLRTAANLLECSDQEVVTAIAQGDLATDSLNGIPRLPWEEVALAAAERWPQEIIEAALGEDAAMAVPELVRLTDLHVRVPRFGVLVLGRIAQREGSTINQVLARQLVDLAVAEADVLERSVSGIAAAVRWPLS